MRLSINNWSPLVTHFLCLMLGTIIANWQADTPKILSNYHRHKALIPLSPNLLASSLSWSDTEEKQMVGIAKLADSTSEALCRIKPEFINLRQAMPFPVLEVRLREVSFMHDFFTKKKSKAYRIFPLGLISSLPLCHERPKISYGSSFN